MKILPIDKVREADAYTIAHEPISSVDLMERAAEKCVSDFLDVHISLNDIQNVKIFVGTGNNGGDGLVIARLLSQKNINISVYVVRFSNNESDDFSFNFKKLKNIEHVKIHDIFNENQLPEITSYDLVIDSVFGSGLTRHPSGLAAEVIKHINQSYCEVISIDIPSGLFSDISSKDHQDVIIKADTTLSFLPMKLAFMFPENAPFFGDVELLDIQLSEDFIEKTSVVNYLVEKEDVYNHLQKRSTFSHKGTYGHGLLMTGRYGKFGSAVLSSGGCLRSGIGLLTVHTASNGMVILQTAQPEAMLSLDKNSNIISELPDISNYSAIGIGPGIGTEKETQNVVKQLIQNYSSPIVFDADAINILAENKTWLQFLPKGCIFTPHVKEFERLVGKSENEYERNQMQRAFSEKFNCYTILKGHYTSIASPNGNCYFNTTGNPGMATGGSGDVLTGIITGLLAQGYHPKLASIIGVYLHGLAGDLATDELGYNALLAGDIVKNIGKAFLELNFINFLQK